MPTKDRHKYIPRALRCFLAQTYENRELLILDDGGEGAEALLPDDERIRYVRCGRPSSLGAKRNLACELAGGEYIAHWDDDDWSHPDRLATQLEGSPIVAGFSRMLFWDESRAKAQLYCGKADYALGTSLLYRKDWWAAHRFKDHNIGEDNAFVREARRDIRITEGTGLMVATTHANGTSPRSGAENRYWKDAEKAAIPEDYWIL